MNESVGRAEAGSCSRETRSSDDESKLGRRRVPPGAGDKLGAYGGREGGRRRPHSGLHPLRRRLRRAPRLLARLPGAPFPPTTGGRDCARLMWRCRPRPGSTMREWAARGGRQAARPCTWLRRSAPLNLCARGDLAQTQKLYCPERMCISTASFQPLAGLAHAIWHLMRFEIPPPPHGVLSAAAGRAGVRGGGGAGPPRRNAGALQGGPPASARHRAGLSRLRQQLLLTHQRGGEGGEPQRDWPPDGLAAAVKFDCDRTSHCQHSGRCWRSLIRDSTRDWWKSVARRRMCNASISSSLRYQVAVNGVGHLLLL